MKVVVTGIGIISAIGNSADECRDNLILGKTGIGEAHFLDTNYVSSMPFGEVPYTTQDLLAKATICEEGISRTEALASIAVNQAIDDAGLSKVELQSFDTAFISASTVGGMSSTDQMHGDINLIGESSDFLDSYNLGEHALNIMKRLGIKGVTTTFNTACSSSANAIMLGAKLIKSGRAKRAIVGGTDALAKFTVNGFNSLRILSSSPCMPFDERRTGLNLGEGAAYLVLESDEASREKKKYAEVLGYGNANDAFHASSISEEATGVIKSMTEALRSAGISASQIDYINAHGTGTENNDSSEQKGIRDLFEITPPFQSTKSYTGHTLAASGAIEAVFSISAINNNEIYTSLNCDQPITQFGLTPISKYEKKEVNYVLSNSFGFGGNCSSLVFSQV